MPIHWRRPRSAPDLVDIVTHGSEHTWQQRKLRPRARAFASFTLGYWGLGTWCSLLKLGSWIVDLVSGILVLAYICVWVAFVFLFALGVAKLSLLTELWNYSGATLSTSWHPHNLQFDALFAFLRVGISFVVTSVDGFAYE